MIINFVSIILIISYLSGKTLGYEMIINDEFSTYVKDKKILNEYYFEKLHNTSSESRKVVKSDSINFNLKLIMISWGKTEFSWAKKIFSRVK